MAATVEFSGLEIVKIELGHPISSVDSLISRLKD